MQIMPETADTGGRQGRGEPALRSRPIRCRWASAISPQLLDQLDGNLLELGGAYNAGPRAVNRWLATKAGKDDPLLFVESIPVAETRSYVKRLMEYHWMYRRRFGQDAKSLDETARGQWPIYRPAHRRPRPALPAEPQPGADDAAPSATVDLFKAWRQRRAGTRKACSSESQAPRQRAFVRAGEIDGAGAQMHQPPPADAAHQVGIFHPRQGAIAAQLLVKPLGDQQGPGRHRAAPAARCADAALASARRASPPKSSSAKRKTAARGRSGIAWAMKDSASTSQPGSSAVSGCRNSSQSLRASAAPAISWALRLLPALHDMGAGRVGDRQRAVGRAAIGDDHFAHHAAHRRRDQAVETARQRRSAFRVGMTTLIMRPSCKTG